MLTEEPGLLRQRGIPFRNDSGAEIPPHGLLRVLDRVTPPAGQPEEWLLKVAKPDEDGKTYHLVNGPFPVPVGQHGEATFDFPTLVAYDASQGQPAPGESWGSQSGSFLLSKSFTGYRILAGPKDGLVEVIPEGEGGSGDRVVHANGLPPESDGGIDFFPGNFDELQQQGAQWLWVVPIGDLYIVNANPVFV